MSKEYEIYYKCPMGHEWGHIDSWLVPTEDGQDFTEDLDETAQECPTCGSMGFRELRPLD